jgi:hypothetical protein
VMLIQNVLRAKGESDYREPNCRQPKRRTKTNK